MMYISLRLIVSIRTVAFQSSIPIFPVCFLPLLQFSQESRHYTEVRKNREGEKGVNVRERLSGPNNAMHASFVRVKMLVNTRTKDHERMNERGKRSVGWSGTICVRSSVVPSTIVFNTLSLAICTLIAITAVAVAVAVAAIDAPIFHRFIPSENCHAVLEFIDTFNIRSRSLLFIARRK